MKVLTDLVARIMFAITMLMFGIFHFMNAEFMAENIAPFGGVFIVYITGLALIAAAVSIVIKKKAALACLLLGAFLLLTVITVHIPAMQTDEMAMSQVLKDLGLAGGAWFMAGVFKKEEDAAGSSV
jgi:uncharacterized membrane protein YphA (DoxX/SURF4 family)